jgi:DNA-binding SARP family transcriptional activator
MADLHLDLMGQPVVRRVGSGAAPAAVPLSLQPFLAFLSLERGTGCHRDRVIDCLWPDVPCDQGRRRLNTAVWRARQLFDARRDGAVVATRAGHIALDRRSVEIDVVPTIEALTDERRNAASAGDPAALDDLRRAVLLDARQFLAGNYDDWVVQARHQLELAVIRGIETLLEVESSPATSIRWAELLVRLDPLREDAHRQLIRLYAEAGRRSDALRQYDVCARRLLEDLGVEPLLETTLVAAGVREGISPNLTDLRDPRHALHALRVALASCQDVVTQLESAIAGLPEHRTCSTAASEARSTATTR